MHSKAASSEKSVFEHAQNALSDHPAHAQSMIRAFCSPFIHYIVSNGSISGQLRFFTDCTDSIHKLLDGIIRNQNYFCAFYRCVYAGEPLTLLTQSPSGFDRIVSDSPALTH